MCVYYLRIFLATYIFSVFYVIFEKKVGTIIIIFIFIILALASICFISWNVESVERTAALNKNYRIVLLGTMKQARSGGLIAERPRGNRGSSYRDDGLVSSSRRRRRAYGRRFSLGGIKSLKKSFAAVGRERLLKFATAERAAERWIVSRHDPISDGGKKRENENDDAFIVAVERRL